MNAKATRIVTGDVVRHSGVTFNRYYPEAVGVVQSVTKESNGIFAMVTWTIDLTLATPGTVAAARANGTTGDFHQFTARAALRVLHEIK